MPELRVKFNNKELSDIEAKASKAGLSKSAYVESAALYSHIAPSASDDLINALRNLHDACILLKGLNTTEEQQDAVRHLRGLIRKIEKEYFSNY